MLIFLAIKDLFRIHIFKHIAHGSWFVNRQEINHLELFWLELLELLETVCQGVCLYILQGYFSCKGFLIINTAIVVRLPASFFSRKAQPKHGVQSHLKFSKI